jgi:HK97 gp10 family phage protein
VILASLEGLGELLSTLSTAGKVVRVATGKKSQALGQVLVDEMREKVAVESGTLRDSIRAEPNEDGTVTVKAGGTPETARPTKSGTVYDEARIVEFGRPASRSGPGQAARPFFRPTVDAHRAELGPALIEAGNDALKDL